MRKVTCLVLVLVFAIFSGNSIYAETTHNAFKYLSPRPDARYVPPQSTLIFRAGDELMQGGTSWTSLVKVEGERSGIHEGSWITADDSYTIIFKPHRGFAIGEIVTVSLNAEDIGQKAKQRSYYSHQFEIAPRIVRYEPDYEETMAMDRGTMEILDVEDGSRPFLAKKDHGDFVLPVDFPEIGITVCDAPADGYVSAI